MPSALTNSIQPTTVAQQVLHAAGQSSCSKVRNVGAVVSVRSRLALACVGAGAGLGSCDSCHGWVHAADGP